MKSWFRLFVVLMLLFGLTVGTALATDTPENVQAKLQRFQDALTKAGVPLEDGDWLQKPTENTDEYSVTTFYTPAEYMMVSTLDDGEASFTYQLSISHADVPEGVNVDELYTAFLNACADTEGIDGALVVAWLRENMVQTSSYGISASTAFDGFTATLSGSLSDSGESVDITRYEWRE